MKTNIKRVVLICVIFISFFAFTSCATDQETMRNDLMASQAALANERKAVANIRQESSNLAYQSNYALSKVEQTKPIVVAREFDEAQLRLNGPVDKTAVLEEQVKDLIVENTQAVMDRSKLQTKIKTLQEVNDKAKVAFDKAAQQIAEAAQREAICSDELRKDDSWGGLFGLVKYAKRSVWTMFYIALSVVALILVLRFSSIWVSEAGLILSAVENAAAFGFCLVARLIPGAVSAAGWMVKEIESECFASASPSTTDTKSATPVAPPTVTTATVLN